MVALPRIAKAEDDRRELKRLLIVCFASSLPVALVCMGVIYLAAPVLANGVYRMAELTALFRMGAPLTALFALCHLTTAIATSLGQQKRSMYGALGISLMTLAATFLWAADPSMRLSGVIAAQALGQVLSIVWNLGVLVVWRREKRAAQSM